MPYFNNSTTYSNESAFYNTQGVPTCLENSFPVKIGKTFVLSVILLSSLVGNALIVIIVYKREELRKTINYFIVNMAISDLVFPLTTIPDTVFATAKGSWQWPIHGTAGLILCKLQNFLQQVSLAVSVGSLVWIAVDRFIAVVLPMKVHLISSRTRVFAIASTWIVATIANCLDLYAFELIPGYSGEMFCTDSYNTAYSNKTYQRVRTVLIHIAPLIAMTILYVIIAVTLRRQDKALQSRAVHQKDQRKQRAIKMALCVMVAFYVCTLP
ncbi:QRFP-like peptide receptor [Oculina patagonica]